MNLNAIHIAYFIGIGGIGMSALSRWMKGRGIQVSGYDRVATPLTSQLIAEGIPVFFEPSVDRARQLEDRKEDVLVVVTPAIPKTHPEIRYFESHGFNLMKRAQVLGVISSDIKTVAVAGTHGKTTTTAMLAHIFHQNNMNATAFVGGILTGHDTNLIQSGNPTEAEWFIVEADEFDRSFLNLNPHYSVITSVDPDHLDIYADYLNLLKGFQQFPEKTTS
jgi:UDP-N-acetylmuramate--alanine ligase